VALYAFTFRDDTILLDADDERAACCRAFFEVADEYDVAPGRLETMGWPEDADFFRLGDIDEPVILEGG